MIRSKCGGCGGGFGKRGKERRNGVWVFLYKRMNKRFYRASADTACVRAQAQGLRGLSVPSDKASQLNELERQKGGWGCSDDSGDEEDDGGGVEKKW